MTKAPTIEVRIAAVTVQLGGKPVRWSFAKEDYDPAITTASSLTVEGYEDSPWFVFYAGDCAWPSLHIIRAESWEAACEEFIVGEADRGHYLIRDDDPDYTEDDGHCTGDGRRVDTSCFMGYVVDGVVIEVQS